MGELKEGVKYDKGKPRVDLFPPEALLAISEVLTYGAAKYADHNWRKGMNWSRLVAAAHRHLAAFQLGQDVDPESGLPHLAHAGCCIAFLIAYQQSGQGTDDRYKILPGGGKK